MSRCICSTCVVHGFGPCETARFAPLECNGGGKGHDPNCPIHGERRWTSQVESVQNLWLKGDITEGEYRSQLIEALGLRVLNGMIIGDSCAAPPPRKYYIWDKRTVVGNCAMFWRVKGAGYSCDLNEAQISDEKEAESFRRSDRHTDVPIDKEWIDAIATKHVRASALVRIERALQRKWAIVPCSCVCGGQFAFLDETGRMIGCICHTDVPA